MKRVFLIFVMMPVLSLGQCLQDVNFNDWQVLGNPDAEWFVLDDSTVREYGDAQPPTFFVSPYHLLNIKITGTMRVDLHNDADFVGLVFGYQAPENGTPDNLYHFILFDWKKQSEPFQGIYASEGMSLCMVNMEMSYDQTWQYFWGHFQNGNAFKVLATNYGSLKGWEYNVDYHYELVYTATRIIIIINGDEVFNVTGCFKSGRFGFYSFSQQNSIFSSFNYSLKVDFLADRTNICEGESVNFTATDPLCSTWPSNLAGHLWDFGDGTGSDEINTAHTYTTQGNYLVKFYVTDDAGCMDSASAVITVNDFPEADLGPDTLVEYGSSVVLEAGISGATYEWSTGANTSSITLEKLTADTLISVIVSNNGCFSEDEILIRVGPPPVSKVFVPNAFTPNGDGVNDTFSPTMVNVDKSDFLIYDRWGQQLFQTNDPGIKWDGSCGTKPCPGGVYVWKLVYDAFLDDESIEQQILSGTVVLIR